MQTVVLAAGRGTRMGPLTEDRPKPMLPVAGRPVLEHVLERTAAAGASSFVIVIGYRGETIRERFGPSFDGRPITYVEQKSADGTADALATAVDALEAEHFAVVNGDVLIDEESLTRLFAPRPAVAAASVDDPSSFGVLTVEDGQVTAIVEKPDRPQSDLVNAGAYVFSPAARDWVDVPETARGERELTDVLARACRETAVAAVPVERWLDVGRPWDLLEGTTMLLEEHGDAIDGTVHERVTLEGPIRIEEGATVRTGSIIEGPALVQAGATVGPNAYVRAGTVLGPETSVGHAVEIKHSILMAGANVNHLSYVGDSVIGRHVNLGAGTVVANLRHDGEPIHVTIGGERRSTGRRKFGVVVGDGVKTGINTSLYPGITLSSDAVTRPGAVVERNR